MFNSESMRIDAVSNGTSRNHSDGIHGERKYICIHHFLSITDRNYQ